jgi:hypothetical protein
MEVPDLSLRSQVTIKFDTGSLSLKDKEIEVVQPYLGQEWR